MNARYLYVGDIERVPLSGGASERIQVDEPVRDAIDARGIAWLEKAGPTLTLKTWE
jgi:hypothetical protein